MILLASRSMLMLLVVVTVASAQAKDTIMRRGSTKMISGKVGKVSPDFVTITSGGKSHDIPVDEVETIRFSDDPSGLVSVRSQVRNGQLEDAKKRLETVKVEGRDFVKQDIAFFKAVIEAKMALRGEVEVRSAAGKISAFLKSNPNSFRYYDACEAMGNLAMSLGRADSATKYFDKMVKSKSAGIAARGALLTGDAYLLQGDLSKANTMFERCAKSKDSRLSALGDVGRAACMARTNGGAKQAVAAIEKVIAENESSDTELFARAYNAMGSAFDTLGQKEAALDSYLHTDLLFYRDSEKHAEALYHLTRLWSAVNKPSESSKARKTLKQRYPSSTWAKK